MAFYSKIILFGEYATLVGAPALAIPLHAYKAEWSRAEQPDAGGSRTALWQLYVYLDDLKQQKKLLADLDLQAFSAALNSGFWLKSNIPNGYGLGSSGAVAAAVYHEFCAAPSRDLAVLKQLLAQIEAHFHGTSSGIDPLVSLVQQPLLLNNSTDIQKVAIENAILKHFFIIDTQKKRNTEHFVGIFKEKIANNAAFAKICVEELKKTTEMCIKATLSNDFEALSAAIALLSQIQYDNFAEMIPESMRRFWETGLQNGAYTMKLCGAGGGGFLMGFAPNFEALPEPLRLISSPLIP